MCTLDFVEAVLSVPVICSRLISRLIPIQPPREFVIDIRGSVRTGLRGSFMRRLMSIFLKLISV
jgi:hypothetical protein